MDSEHNHIAYPFDVGSAARYNTIQWLLAPRRPRGTSSIALPPGTKALTRILQLPTTERHGTRNSCPTPNPNTYTQFEGHQGHHSTQNLTSRQNETIVDINRWTKMLAKLLLVLLQSPRLPSPYSTSRPAPGSHPTQPELRGIPLSICRHVRGDSSQRSRYEDTQQGSGSHRVLARSSSAPPGGRPT